MADASGVLYTDADAHACAWLGELVRQGHLSAGRVLPRDIKELQADDLDGYRRVHLFAGIGGWELALQLAGWPDDLPIWTGSCPCQPFSQAGAGRGTDDPRHLWPDMRRLIAECRPPVVAGEQVASPAGRAWLAAVRADLEALGYAVGAADLCAAGVGAPHIRQRLFWIAERVAFADRGRCQEQQSNPRAQTSGRSTAQFGGSGAHHGLANADGGQPRQAGRVQPGREHRQQPADGRVGGLADPARTRPQGRAGAEPGQGHQPERTSSACGLDDPGSQRVVQQQQTAAEQGGDRQNYRVSGASGGADRPSPHHSGWAAPDWLHCRDGKWRPVEPGTFPLAHGLPARVGRLRGYGNAIVPQVAAAFLMAYLDTGREAG
jgi:DNA (cytosine-5)-methyltransferase 1